MPRKIVTGIDVSPNATLSAHVGLTGTNAAATALVEGRYNSSNATVGLYWDASAHNYLGYNTTVAGNYAASVGAWRMGDFNGTATSWSLQVAAVGTAGGAISFTTVAQSSNTAMSVLVPLLVNGTTDDTVNKLQVAGGVSAAVGAVGAPSYTFAGDLTTGMLRSGASAIAFACGGADRLRFGGNFFMVNQNAVTTGTGAIASLQSVTLHGADASQVTFAAAAYGAAPGYFTRRANGTAAAMTGLVAGDQQFVLLVTGYAADATTPAFSSQKNAYDIRASETWTLTTQGLRHHWYTVNNGATATGERMRLDQDGALLLTAFTNDGVNKLQVSGGISAATGAVGAPSFCFASDITTGWWRPAASTVALSLGGAEVARFTTSTLKSRPLAVYDNTYTYQVCSITNSGTTPGIEFGRIDGTGTFSAFFDWHSSTVAVDYDFRMQVSGDTGGVNSAGTMTFQGATTFLQTRLVVQQGAYSTASPGVGFTVTGGAHSALAASTEYNDIYGNLSRTVTFATGALTTQRAVRFDAPTYAFVGASTITTAATVAISGAPAAGTNATLTNSYALWVQAGVTRFDGDVSMFTGVRTLTVRDAAGTRNIAILSDQGAATALEIGRTDGTASQTFIDFHTSAANLDYNVRISAAGDKAVGSGDLAFTAGTYFFTGTAITTAGVTTGFTFQAGAHTNVTAATENVDAYINLARTLTWTAAGTVAQNRSVLISAPTLASAAATTTFTAAATFAITGAPVAGTNTAITNAYAVWVQGGLTKLDGGINIFGGSNTTTAFGLSQNAFGSGTPSLMVLTGAAHTALAASTEAIDVNVNLARTVQFSTGALTTQRAMLVQAPTYAFVGASTITKAATVAIGGAPVAGTNATITSSYALWVQSGLTQLDGSCSITTPANATRTVLGLSQGSVAGTSVPTVLNVSGGTHTTVTASSEVPDVDVALSTVQWATGAITNQRAVRFFPGTYSFVGASTITNAATVAIVGPPVAGTNATITNNYALWIQAGKLQTAASTTTVAGLNLTHGSAPTSPVDGDVWTTTAGMFARINGGTVGPFGAGGGGTIGGSIASTQIPFGSGANTITGSANFTFTTVSTVSTVTLTGSANFIGGLNTTNQLATIATFTGSTTGVNQTASTEIIDVNFNLARSVQFAAGFLTTQRSVVVQAPTYSFSSSSTIGTAATVAITGAPTPSTFATITNAYSLWCQAGLARFDGGVSAISGVFNGAINTLAITQTAIPGLGGTGTALTLTGGAHSAVTASTENIDVNINLNRTVTWQTGALTTQRFFVVQAPTVAFAGSSFLTNAATFAITGAPVAGTLASITNSYALWVQSGKSEFDGVVGIAVPAITTVNTTTALLVQAGANNNVPVATENNDVYFNLARTMRWNDNGSGTPNTVTTQRAFLISNPTLSSAQALGTTVTTAATVAIVGAPVASTNVTITNSYALWVQAGLTKLDGGLSVSGANTNTNGNVTFTQGTATASFITFTQAAQTSGTPTLLTLTGASHTTVSAGQEVIDVNFNLARTVQWNSTATVSTQRAISITAPTYAATGASAITTAATLAISGAPIAGASMTITNSYALLISTGKLQTAASTTTVAGLGLPHGSAPTSPVNGDVWTTTAGLFAQINGSTVGPFSTSTATIGGSIASTQVSYGSGANTITGSAGFTYVAATGLSITTGTTPLTLTQSVATTGSPTGFSFTGAAHTTLTAVTEVVDVNFNLNRTVQINGGGYTNQRAFLVQAPTYGYVSAATIVNAATFAITGAPTAGTNATFTNAYAFWVQGGKTRLDGYAIVAPPTAAVGATAWSVVPAAYTAQTTTAENIDVLFDLSHAVTWATGAIALQRAFVVNAPTYAFAGASTITSAATVYISGAPIASTNATITNSYALWVAGFTKIDSGLTVTTSNQSRSTLAVTQGATNNVTTLPAFIVTAGAHTTLPLSTEVIDVDINLNRTATFSTGALTNQRAFYVRAPTYAFGGASTITTAATLAISGAPALGANATITNNYAFLVEAGNVRFAGTTSSTTPITGAFLVGNGTSTTNVGIGNGNINAGGSISAGVAAIALGGTPVVGNLPVWVRVTATFTNFSAAATTNSPTLFTLPAGGIIHAVKIKHSAAFTGGTIATYTVSVGIGGNTTKYAGAFNVFQAPGNTLQQATFTGGTENHGATTAILATATSTGGNLSVATAGSVDIWVLVSVAV